MSTFDEPTGEARKSSESASKPRLDLLPPAAMEEIAEVLAFGANKYGAYNWARGGRWGGISPHCCATCGHGGAARIAIPRAARATWRTPEPACCS